uniref:Uncharacterized protein n=1 Tax=Arundo donax TaxID=35708 RepID=A0A0A9FUT0_ARUDO
MLLVSTTNSKSRC